MKSVYIIMKKRESPIFITEATPHLVCLDRNIAKDTVKILNEKATTNNYWFVTAKVKQ